MKFPVTKTSGSGQVKIYKNTCRVKGTKYTSYIVRYYLEGKPVQKKFGSFDGPTGADKHADEILARINAGSLAVLTLTAYDQAQLIEAKQILAGRASIVEAARDYVRTHSADFKPKKLSEIFTELLTAKKRDGLSDEWIQEIKSKGGSFNKKFGHQFFSEISGPEVDAWLTEKNIGAKTKNNYRGVISAIVTFAKRREYVPEAFNILKHVPRLRATPKEDITIWTRDDFTIWFHHATEPMKLLFIFGCFAGLRHKEVARLHWEHIKWEDDAIVVNALSSKVRERRLAPILPVLKDWLKDYRERKGKVIKIKGTYHAIDFLKNKLRRIYAKDAPVWKHNAPRHTFISCRVAITRKISETADECGTSEHKIKSNYLKRILQRVAEDFFAFSPSEFTNHLQIMKDAGKIREKPQQTE